MKILVTGAKGFIGKNLIVELRNMGYTDILEYDIDTKEDLLDTYTSQCEFIFHLAGVNRPKSNEDFMIGNFGFTSLLLDKLKLHNNKSPILLTSSTQAEFNNDYGLSKKAGEDLLFTYSESNNVSVYIYRLPNVFGKWCKPNYNSAVATFCYNITHDLPIQINDASHQMTLVYIDDVINEFISAMTCNANKESNFYKIPLYYDTTLGEIADTIKSFPLMRSDLSIPNFNNPLTKKLYSTYLSYLPSNKFSYPLKMNIDERGSFTEIIRTISYGQFSVNISKPGITKGNHWHHTKNEKFVVVSGDGLIQFRKVDSNEIIDYHVSGDKIEVVDIPVGYTHNIINLGDTDLITFMWCNECFDKNKPDTYYLEVNPK